MLRGVCLACFLHGVGVWGVCVWGGGGGGEYGISCKLSSVETIYMRCGRGVSGVSSVQLAQRVVKVYHMTNGVNIIIVCLYK